MRLPGIIALCGVFRNDEVLNHAVEFTGGGVAGLSMEDRMSIANMTTEWGALAGVFEFDGVLRDYLYGRADHFRDSGGELRYKREDVDRWYAQRDVADGDATYAVDLALDLSTVIPHVSGPDNVKTMTSLPAIAKQRVEIQKAYLLSCVNGRLEDIGQAAAVLEGKRVAEGVKFYVAAASREIEERARGLGYWQVLVHAGAIMLPPGCGPCIGLGQGTMEDGEVGISATNRNFKGRMGSRDAKVYLASPAVVAASAVAGYITAPGEFDVTEPVAEIKSTGQRSSDAAPVEILEGFPERVSGRALFMNRDNLNTDGIYAGKWTYKDDMTPDQMAGVVFENYDENFGRLYQPGDIVVSGRNFGSGSSREQAATALRYRGIPCVVAASFSQTYKRNAFNNGFPVFESPKLVEYLCEKYKEADAPTVVGPQIEVDFRTSVIHCDGKEFSFPPLGKVPQQLIVAGGAESLVKKRLKSQ